MNVLDEMTAEAELNVKMWQDRLNYLRDWQRKKGPSAPPPGAAPPGGKDASEIRGRKVPELGRSPFLTISDAIRYAVSEKPRTSVEVADRVQQLIPNASRSTIGDIVFQLMRKGEFAKGDDLKLRVVQREVTA